MDGNAATARNVDDGVKLGMRHIRRLYPEFGCAADDVFGAGRSVRIGADRRETLGQAARPCGMPADDDNTVRNDSGALLLNSS